MTNNRALAARKASHGEEGGEDRDSCGTGHGPMARLRMWQAMRLDHERTTTPTLAIATLNAASAAP